MKSMYCSNCGNQVDVGAKFCPSCGQGIQSTQNNIETSTESSHDRLASSTTEIGFRCKYLSFDGRISRGDYIRRVLKISLVPIPIIAVLAALAYVAGGLDAIILVLIVTGIFGIVSSIMALSLGVRRMHDLGKSGWSILSKSVKLKC